MSYVIGAMIIGALAKIIPFLRVPFDYHNRIFLFLLRASENNYAVLGWYLFCVLSLQEGLPRFLMLLGDIEYESPLFVLRMIHIWLGAFWFTLVAMGLPFSMFGIPYYRIWLFVFSGPLLHNRSAREWRTFLLQLAGLAVVEYGVYAHVRRMDESIPGTTPLSVVVDFMEEVPEMFADVFRKSAGWIGWFAVMYCVLVYAIRPMLQRRTTNAQGRRDNEIANGYLREHGL